MLVHSEISLSNFEFWAGAKDFANELTTDELDHVEFLLNDIYPDGMNETLVNNIFWFDSDWVCQMLGYEDYEDFLRQRVK